MKVSGTVVDKATGDPIPFASVYVTDGSNTYGPGTMTNNKGEYVLDSLVLNDPAIMIGFSNIGYKDIEFIPGQSTVNVQMETTAQELEPVYVTAKKKITAIAKKNPTVILIVTGVAAVSAGLFLFKKYGIK